MSVQLCELLAATGWRRFLILGKCEVIKGTHRKSCLINECVLYFQEQRLDEECPDLEEQALTITGITTFG